MTTPNETTNRRTLWLLGGLAGLAVVAVLAFVFMPTTSANVTFTHQDDTRLIIQTAAPTVTLATFDGSERHRDALHVTLTSDTDGTVPTTRNTTGDTTTVTFDASVLSEREHRLTLAITDQQPRTLTALVDRTPPELEITAPTRAVIAGETFLVTGNTDPDVTVTVGPETITSSHDGTFELSLTDPSSDTIDITATDQAGNTTQTSVTLTVIASRVENTDIRALHVSFHAWGDPARRERMYAMIDAGIVNAIQFDLKDESGHVGHQSAVAFANDTGAALNRWDLADVVAELHSRDIAVIGRIVAFADPIVARHAYATGQRDLAIQTPAGALYTGSYQGFTNFTHPTIIDYNIDLAIEAAAAGVDHILWDYLRRPDGRMSGIVIPGLDGSVEDAIVSFTALADEALYPWRIQHGASLYGISADRPHEIGQDVARLSEHLDYVAPMIYPSHWGPGEYGVADPNRQPQAIVKATLNVWLNATANTRARVIPWLEDTSYRAYDRPFHVREQHRGTYAVGITEWLMWDAAARYTPDAYDIKPPA